MIDRKCLTTRSMCSCSPWAVINILEIIIGNYDYYWITLVGKVVRVVSVCRVVSVKGVVTVVSG